MTKVLVVNATKVLCLRKWPILDHVAFAEYGCAEIEHVAEHFSTRLQKACPQFSTETVLLVWSRLKKMVVKRHAAQIKTISWADVYDEDLPQIMLLIDLLLSLRPTSVSCETCFSQMKLTKTSRRVNLKSATLNDLLQVKLVSPDIGVFNPEEAIDQWLTAAVGRRRLYYKRKRRTSDSTALEIDVTDQDLDTRGSPETVNEENDCVQLNDDEPKDDEEIEN